MCGICGYIGNNLDQIERDSKTLIMSGAIFHRGPDDDGFFSDQNATLSMRRLSIIDLTTGKQPIYSNSKRFLIFFNGEIYNYLELSILLKNDGYFFQTTSDTEVVVNLFEKFGSEMLPMLKGMFAFCIYDTLSGTYFFARDRFGEKPFFYYSGNNQFIFSSEINSLISSNAFPKKLNKKLLSTYLKKGFVPDPFTLLENIFSLPPGHFLVLNEERKIEISSYFEVKYHHNSSIKTLDEAASFISPILEKAVQRQMVSDVSIGAFLSGGIDSSTVVALMQQNSSKPIDTFTVKFQTTGYDESKIASIVSEKLGTNHHEIIVENSQFNESQFWKILKHTGVPFPDSSAIPTDFVTKAISKHVKVALSGDGGDELFGGYEVFDWITKMHSLKFIPEILRYSSASFFKMLNNSKFGNNQLRRLEKALNISCLSTNDLLEEIHALFDSNELNKLYAEGSSFCITNPNVYEGWSILRKAMYYRIKQDLPLDMLVKVDRMSMSNSLEVRSPFLDPDLFEASCELPDNLLRNKGLGKLVIRKIMENMLPTEVFNHPKSGFSIPLHDFRNAAFTNLAKSLLSEPYMTSLFNNTALTSILQEGLYSNSDSNTGSIYRKTHQLWSLMMLSGWIKMYDVEV